VKRLAAVLVALALAAMLVPVTETVNTHSVNIADGGKPQPPWPSGTAGEIGPLLADGGKPQPPWPVGSSHRA
jgi:hypothetical protein